MSSCIFCQHLPKVNENDLAYSLLDIKPISQGHMLFITKRHIENMFLANDEEIKAVYDLIRKAKVSLDKQYQPAGYNITANCGAIAGQVIMHAHVHLIPRYA